MVKRVLTSAGVVLACYSGLSGNVPFPCANDHTCPSGFYCNGGGDAGAGQCGTSCDAPTVACGGSTCVDTSTDTNNCGACAEVCATSCADSICVNACTLITNAGCTNGSDCLLAFQPTTTLWGTFCGTPGTAALGESCNPPSVTCASGLECVTTSGVATCVALCDAQHPCAHGPCNTNSNIPSGGGYCSALGTCGASNFTVQCSTSGTCPLNSTCQSATAQSCACNAGFKSVHCDGTPCTTASPCPSPDWWCD